MYLIKARVKITSNKPHEKYKSLPVSGLFLPKGKKKRHADIEKQCSEYIISNLKNGTPELHFEITSLKITSQACDFVINEAKHS